MLAGSWEQLARAVRHSFTGRFSLDELLQFHHGTLTVSATALRNIKHIVYQQLEEIPGLLDANSNGLGFCGPPVPPVMTTAAKIPTHQPPIVAQKQAPSLDSRVELAADDSEPKSTSAAEHAVQDEDGDEPAGNIEDVARAIASEQASEPVQRVTSTEEVQAAATIVACYRRYIARKPVQSKKTYDETRVQIYRAFRAASAKMDWPHTLYRLLYLGPLPHLFAVVEAMKNSLYNAKNSAKHRLNIVRHLDLETMGSTLTEITYVSRWRLS